MLLVGLVVVGAAGLLLLLAVDGRPAPRPEAGIAVQAISGVYILAQVGSDFVSISKVCLKPFTENAKISSFKPLPI